MSRKKDEWKGLDEETLEELEILEYDPTGETQAAQIEEKLRGE